jgi:RNA recognition motif-containing protein
MFFIKGLKFDSWNLRNMKPIFCGNIEFDARQSDLERLFRRYGRVERVDMKSGKVFFFLVSLKCY